MIRIKFIFGFRFIRGFMKQLFSSYTMIKKFNGDLNIIVNGPSLANDAEHIDRTKEMMVVNQFVRHELFTELTPKFYLIQDPYFWNLDVQEHWSEKRKLTLSLLNEKVAWPMYLIIPSSADIEFLQSQIENSYIEIVTFNDIAYQKPLSDDSYSGLEVLLLKKNRMAPSPSNVLLMCLYVGSLTGFEKLLVYGADMSFFKLLSINQKTNAVGITEEHFYGDEFFEIFEGKSTSRKTTLSRQLEKWAYIFKDFELLRKYLDLQKVQIINKSNFSFIDSLDREDD